MSLVPPHVGISLVTRATARRHLHIALIERLRPHAMFHIRSRLWPSQPFPLNALSTRRGRSNSPSEASVAADAPAPRASELHSPPPPPPLSDRDLRHRLNARSAAPAPAQTGVATDGSSTCLCPGDCCNPIAVAAPAATGLRGGALGDGDGARMDGVRLQQLASSPNAPELAERTGNASQLARWRTR